MSNPKTLPNSHPLEVIERFNRLQPEPVTYEFSRYIYKPQKIGNDREYFQVPAGEVKAKFEELLASLKEDQEVAMHSVLRFPGGLSLHLPMLDLMEDGESPSLEALSQVMREFKIPEFGLYKTGRSAHVYGLGTLTDAELIRFFGRALLLNLPGKAPVVDTRWIGHRLMAGCGSLRWSCNTKQYLQYPELLGFYKV